MKAQANQSRPGWVIEHNNKHWFVTKINLIQPGKGGKNVGGQLIQSRS